MIIVVYPSVPTFDGILLSQRIDRWLARPRIDDESVWHSINMEPGGAEDLRSQVLQTTLEQLSSSGEDAADCCIICLDNLVEQCEAQPCQHNNFDLVCLITWLQENPTCPTCPLCKVDVYEIRYGLSQDGKEAKIYKFPVRPKEPDKPHGLDEDGLRGLTSRSEHRSSHSARFSRAQQSHEDEAIQRRRHIYRHKLYSLHAGSNRRQPAALRYRELSPELFRTDPDFVSRARMWLSRELQVFEFLNASDGDSLRDHRPVPSRRRSKAEFLLEYIIAILKTIDTQGSSGHAEDMIQEYLGRENTRLFLHELRAWLRSPCRYLSEWDRVVQYNPNSLPANPTIVESEPGTRTPTGSNHCTPGRRTKRPTTDRMEQYRYRPPRATK